MEGIPHILSDTWSGAFCVLKAALLQKVFLPSTKTIICVNIFTWQNQSYRILELQIVLLELKNPLCYLRMVSERVGLLVDCLLPQL